ncbi:MAG: hypothetical protein IAF94_11300 [Pirellulaceae bacterium]|nr:hypothetical protein [Pirellulaceae bacterium]
MERGKPLEIKATVTRLHGHKEKIGFSIPGLPAGITLTAPETVPEKGGEVILKLEAKKDAAAFSGALRIMVGGKSAVFSFKDDSYRGPYVLDEMQDIWVVLAPVKVEKK